MNWFTAIVTYLTLWWIVLFCVLPFGVRTQSDAGEVIHGTDPGAPVVPHLKRKLLWTTLITAVLWAIGAAALMLGWVDLGRPRS